MVIQYTLIISKQCTECVFLLCENNKKYSIHRIFTFNFGCSKIYLLMSIFLIHCIFYKRKFKIVVIR